MKRTCAIVLISALTFTATAGARERESGPQNTSEVWRAFAGKLPIGSLVKIRTTTGERLTAILFVVDDKGLTVKPKTRYPEPARHLSFDQLEDIEVERGGVSFSKYAGVGAAVGAVVFLWLIEHS